MANNEQIVLYPKHADFSFASGVIVEPYAPPYNIGGWNTSSEIIFPLQLEEEAVYTVSLLYSKQASDGSEAPLRVEVLQDKLGVAEGEKAAFSVDIPSTGPDWSTYKELHIGEIRLPAGKSFLFFKDAEENPHQYVMNLREVRLSKKN